MRALAKFDIRREESLARVRVFCPLFSCAEIRDHTQPTGKEIRLDLVF